MGDRGPHFLSGYEKEGLASTATLRVYVQPVQWAVIKILMRYFESGTEKS
jgi:hypothetical protein